MGSWCGTINVTERQVAVLTTFIVAVPAASVPADAARGEGGIPFSSATLPGGPVDVVIFVFTLTPKQVGGVFGRGCSACRWASGLLLQSIARRRSPALA